MKEHIPLEQVRKYFGKVCHKDTAQLEKRILALKVLEKCCQNSPEPLGKIMKDSSLFEIKELTIAARIFGEKSGQELSRMNKSPLHWAALLRNLESFKIIFTNTSAGPGIYKNPKDYYEFTPLHYAAGTVGNFEICEFIINNIEGDKNPKDKLGNTPLHYAAMKGYFHITKLIVEKIQEKNPKNLDLETPLHSAAQNGHLNVYQLLIKNVEDKNPQNLKGLTPLSYAAMKDNNSFEIFLSVYQEEAKNELMIVEK